DERGTFGGEQLAADLEHPDRACQLFDQPERAVAIGEIQRHDQAVLWRLLRWVVSHWLRVFPETAASYYGRQQLLSNRSASFCECAQADRDIKDGDRPKS